MSLIKMQPRKLNLGCGSNKIEGFINIDVEPQCKPDLICNFVHEKLPFKAGTVEEVVLFHTIEHINKFWHTRILAEVWRVLKPSGSFLISYPEFLKCVKNWRTNYRGKKQFWEATIFGRQLYPSDFHVCIMHTPDFVRLLSDCGFIKITSQPESGDTFNTIVGCIKGVRVPNYEDLIKDYMDRFKLIKD